MGELRLILLVAGALLVGGIWWWSRRAKPGDAREPRELIQRRDLREPPVSARAEPTLDTPPPSSDQTTPGLAALQTPSRVAWSPATEPHTRREGEPGSDLDPALPRGDGDAPTVDVSGFDSTRQMVLSLLVLPEHGERFLGADVLSVLEEADLKFGAKRIFHRHDPAGATLWSVANMLEPGTLDPTAVQTDYVHGLVLFAVLPGPRLGSETFADMLATARRMAQRLRGELADADRSSLTPQTIQHLRESVLEFERRRAGAGD